MTADARDGDDEIKGFGAASIVACPNGPLLVRGDVELLDGDGHPVPRTRPTIALCRCGASAVKPFCDGTHKLMRFRTEE
ncbi:CDGSH iron-sulfur domain-containing protein [Ruicaihuangia caeni]|uniref:CDGSH iron-sulfur domain-containing protein n=1 Tax=Ruicaihuangia caeni TaxID=3042517 RepID=A0AAW6T6U3_9MICO|nr:CDGSH iron-sulfur domain-containing protein [Klugiella sp. YN-L-19]MDI2099224.1 CDGSH iron-sulfur domain-containing protein [Klugiella sp. YN-L-19]